MAQLWMMACLWRQPRCWASFCSDASASSARRIRRRKSCTASAKFADIASLAAIEVQPAGRVSFPPLPKGGKLRQAAPRLEELKDNGVNRPPMIQNSNDANLPFGHVWCNRCVREGPSIRSSASFVSVRRLCFLCCLLFRFSIFLNCVARK